MEAFSQLLVTKGSSAQVPDGPAPAMPSGLRGELVILLASILLRRASQEIV